MRIVFFGTPVFAAEIFSFLLDHGVEVVGVVTQPDRPKGRSLHPSFSPVKEVALAHQIAPILQPEKASDPQFLAEIAALKPDLSVVVAYGQILPQKLLDLPRLGSINVHASLLPKFRGAAPIQRAILAGEVETGVCVQKMVKAMDAGDVIAEAKVEISPTMDAGELTGALLAKAKPLLLDVLQNFSSWVVKAKPQDPAQVSFAPKISPEEGKIRWDLPAEAIDRLVRAFSPKPGAWTQTESKVRIKILKTRLSELGGEVPGSLLDLERRPRVVCGSESLELLLVQPEGKRPMEGREWVRGLRGCLQCEVLSIFRFF